MAKVKKESFFERLTKKNAQQGGSSQSNKPPKRKKWVFLVPATILVGAVAAGITIPLAINSTRKIINEKLKDDVLVYTITLPNGEKITYKIGELGLEKANEVAKDPEKQLEQLYKIMVYYLYDQEVKASEEYQRLWNSSREPEEKESKTIALKPISELKKKHENLIADVRDQMIKVFGYEKWEKQFTEWLGKNFNGSKTVEEAVDHQVYQEIQRDALRRFRLSTTANIKDIKRKANADIKKIGADGKVTDEILFRQGDLVFPWLQKDKNYFEIEGIDKKITFVTESFVATEKNGKTFNTETKDGEKFIDSWLAKEKIYLSSRFTLPGVVPATQSKDSKIKGGTWTVNADQFLKTLYMWPRAINNTLKSNFDVISSKLSDYKTIAEKVKNNKNELSPEAIDYGLVLAQLSSDSDEIKNNWGTDGVKSFTNLLTAGGDNALESLSFLSGVLKSGTSNSSDDSKLKEIDLFTELKKIAKEIEKAAGIQDNQIPQYNSNNEENVKKISEYNEKIQEFYENPDSRITVRENDKDVEKKINEYVADAIKKIFVNEQGKYDTVYKLKDQQGWKILLTTKGITLIKSAHINSAPDVKKDVKEMIISDFYLKEKYKNLSGVHYNILAQLNKDNSSKNTVIKALLHDNDFKDHLKKQYNIYDLDKDNNLTYKVDKSGKVIGGKKYTDDDIDNFIEQNKQANYYNRRSDVLKYSKSLETYINTLADSNLNNDFVRNGDNKVYLVNNNDNYKKTAYEILEKVLRDEILNVSRGSK
ncbi:HinT-interacting membrane complex protein P80 [Mycoplasmopsis opalescens]|uniref:HinT-interacting membrane complex protein P80 n=1 Tax=Mycoplasmopsis opalescens TaxID=114886 RepID=UPI0004A6C81B|nr:hypothetical protein [Mycoplasmopsis opalescens]